MELDIRNDWVRPVICVSNEDLGWNTDREKAKLLSVGKIYTLQGIEVHDWHTVVWLKEFPHCRFNSVLFEEVDDEILLTAPKGKAPPDRDNLLVTAGVRAACMDSKGAIDIPSGLEGEEQLAKFIAGTVDAYLKLDDVNFDMYIEDALSKEYGVKDKSDYIERLQNVIKRTYNLTTNAANELIAKANNATSEINGIDDRAEAIGMLRAKLILLDALKEFGFENDTDLFKKE